MARYRATIQGSRGETSRLGTAASGIRTDTNAWDVGVTVGSGTDGDNDVFDIYATAGSNAASHSLYIGTVRLDSDGSPTFYPKG